MEIMIYVICGERKICTPGTIKNLKLFLLSIILIKKWLIFSANIIVIIHPAAKNPVSYFACLLS